MQYARRNRLRNWEYQNQQQLLNLLEGIQDHLKRIGLRAARLTSFLMYLLYGGGKIVFAIARGLFVGPTLIRHVAPNELPLERHEFERRLNAFPLQE